MIMNDKQNPSPSDDFPIGLAAPARRALHSAGYTELAQLNGVSEASIKSLHGIGPNALKQLKEALVARHFAFTKEDT
jgi:hypothetical protein